MDSENKVRGLITHLRPRSAARAAVLSIVLAICATARVYSQGQVEFRNIVSGSHTDAPVSFLNGERLAEGFFGQLFGGPAGTPTSSLQPVLPIVPFRSQPTPAIKGYIIGPIVAIPGVPVNEEATIIMRAFNGSSWETSSCRGESSPIIVRLTGGLGVPANLDGLQPFQVDCIPEPSTIALLLGGIAVFFLKKRLS